MSFWVIVDVAVDYLGQRLANDLNLDRPKPDDSEVAQLGPYHQQTIVKSVGGEIFAHHILVT